MISMLARKPLILVVDDDPGVLRLVSHSLEVGGYQVITSNEGMTALRLIENESPSLVLLDIVMPGIDGLQVCQRIHESSDIPVIMLTVKDEAKEIAHGLDTGADDYLTKPFSTNELLARVRAVLRRTKFPEWMPQPVFTCGELSIDFARHRVTVAEKEVRLSRTEYQLLSTLTRNAGRVLTQDQLLEKAWGWEYRDARHILQVAIARLRQRIGDNPQNPKYIETRTGIGYTCVKPE